MSRCRTLAILLAPLLAWTAPHLHGQGTTVREEQITIATYPFYDPSPLANIGRIYPYHRFDGYSQRSEPRTWQMLTLENPYIRLRIAPQVGGKVWSAVEKSTGKAFIYDNPVVKFRDIALRGPWTSGGIEFNFGVIGHAPSGAFPVDWLVRREEDGSVCVVVGGLDLTSRTEWRVFIRLSPDKAYFETNAFWYNPTPFHQSRYSWTTAAADASSDLTLYIPGTHYIDHSGNAFPWPLDKEGRNLARYADNDFGGSKSYHVLGAWSDWFGGCWEKERFGFGHWAPHEERPGKKIWIWALSREGEIWRDLLTDPPARQYIEMQTGMQHSQANDASAFSPFKHAFLAPHSGASWHELWFPHKGLPAISTASPHGVMQVTFGPERLAITLCALQQLDDDLTVSSGSQILYSRHIRLAPLETISIEPPLPYISSSMRVRVGADKIVYAMGEEEASHLKRPLTAPFDLDRTKAQSAFVRGEEAFRQRDLAAALSEYFQCLQKDGYHVPAITRLAEYFIRAHQLDISNERSRQALAVDAYDPAANFYYALSCRGQGRIADAKDGFAWSSQSPEYRHAALTELAATLFLEKKYARSRDVAQLAQASDQHGMRALQVLALSYEALGDGDRLHATLDEILDLDPLNHFARYEKSLRLPPDEGWREFSRPLQSEFPHQNLMELAWTYINLGLPQKAKAILQKVPSQPMVLYTLSYLGRNQESIEEIKRRVEQANSLPARFVFPFRSEEIDVLLFALQHSRHWKPRYYLALVNWSLARPGPAGQFFSSCGQEPDEACFYLNRASFQMAMGTEDGVPADLERAMTLDPGEWRAIHLLVQHHERSGRAEKALSTAHRGLRHFPGHAALTLDAARAMLFCGRYEDAHRLLARSSILPFEGAREGRELWRQACLHRAISLLQKGNPTESLRRIAEARLWPERLGAGKPYVPDERLEDFLSTLIAERRGDENGAKGFLERIAAFTRQGNPRHASATLVSALALSRLGHREEGEKLMRAWAKESPPANPILSWAQEIWKGGIPPHVRPWEMAAIDRDFPAVHALCLLIKE